MGSLDNDPRFWWLNTRYGRILTGIAAVIVVLTVLVWVLNKF